MLTTEQYDKYAKLDCLRLKRQTIQMTLDIDESGNFIPLSNFLENAEETKWKLNHAKGRFERVW
jgi:hypothetical protein